MPPGGDTRARVHGAIREHPGITFSELRASLGLSTGVVDHHTRMLERIDAVVSVKEGRHRAYYPQRAPSAPARRLGATAARLLALVHERGEATYSEIMRDLDISKASVSRHARNLRDAGHLDILPRADAHGVRLVPVRTDS